MYKIRSLSVDDAKIKELGILVTTWIFFSVNRAHKTSVDFRES